MTIEHAWQEYRTSLKAFLYSKVTNKDDADDLLQDVLIKFHQNISTLNDPKRLKAWLFQITNNTIVDYYRRLGKDQKLETETLWYEIPEKSIQMELAQCIIPFLSQLPEDKATIIQAIDLSGESQKAYALRNNISYSTLKSRVQSARNELKKLFDACCHYQLDNQGNLMAYQEKSKNCNKC